MWCLCSAAGRKTPRPHPPSAPLTGSQALRTPACSPRATAHGWQHQRPATSTKKKKKQANKSQTPPPPPHPPTPTPTEKKHLNHSSPKFAHKLHISVNIKMT